MTALRAMPEPVAKARGCACELEDVERKIRGFARAVELMGAGIFEEAGDQETAGALQTVGKSLLGACDEVHGLVDRLMEGEDYTRPA